MEDEDEVSPEVSPPEEAATPEPQNASAEQLAVAENAKAQGRGQRAELESMQSQKVLETPRTREACRRLGLSLEDLHFRAFESFRVPGDMKEKQQLRFDHYEKKRKDRLAQVLAERAKVIASNARKGEFPGVQSAQFLGMLENLFEKEAKRLETDLKGQLRQHNSLVKENEDQLKKEGILQEKLLERERKRASTQKFFAEVGQKTGAKLNAKLAQSSEIIARQQSDFEEKQAAFAREMVAEQERLQRFQEDRNAIVSDKGAVFRDRVNAMKVKSAQMQEERRIEGEGKLVEIMDRLSVVQHRRDGEQQKRQIRSEEQHLHIMDVRDAKNRMERIDGYRRGELREQLDGNVERIETLLALKDQLLDQRRGRNLKAEATKGSRGLRLQTDCLPGPGAYEAPASCLNELPGVKIGKAKVPGMLDEAIKATAKNPAPGSYDTNMLANGARTDQPVGNGKFNDREKISFLDDAIKAKEAIPAPGRYNASSSTLDSRATKMSRERIVDPNVDKFSAKKFPVWARPGTDTPGPAGYSVDDYTRKEVLRRAQRSLPNLTRDILRPGAANIAVH